MKAPPVHSRDDLARELRAARQAFQRIRAQEPLERYSAFFDAFVPVFNELLAKMPELSAAEVNAEAVADIFASEEKSTAFRYLAAPPISTDDLKVLAEAKLSRRALTTEAGAAKRVRDTVLHLIDPHRFPWIKKGRGPTANEVETAVIASAALVAAKQVETQRRGDAKEQQEELTKQALRDIGFDEVAARDIRLLVDAPAPGQFCGECMFGDTRADLIITLHDRRVMPTECKVSNSAVNSFKRLNHEAVGKARNWIGAFGRQATVPAAVLSGVFSLENLVTAQDAGLALFWGHAMPNFQAWVQSTREA